MTACEDKLPLLNALLDGELDAANTVALEQHIRTCPACAERMARLQDVRDLLRTPGLAYAAPEGLRRRIRLALAEARRPKAGPPWRWLAPGGALGAAAAVLAVLVLTQARPAPLADELVDDHVRSLLASHLTDVATSDRHVVKPWFDGKVTFAPTVIDFAGQGFPLVGGRLDYVRRERAAALVFKRRLHPINVFVAPTASLGRAMPDQSLRGYNLVHWSAGGLTYWAVSDLDPAELRQFRDMYLRALPAS